MSNFTKADKVLAYFELRANASVVSAAKALKMQNPTVRYQLSRLIDTGVITSKRAYVDINRLGYTSYFIFFSLASSSATLRSRLLKKLIDIPQVVWLCEVGGEFHYGVSIAVRSPREVLAFIESLSNTAPNLIRDKLLSIRVSVTTFPKKYLSSGKLSKSLLSQGANTVETVDQTSKSVLYFISKPSFDTERMLAEKSGIVPSTFSRKARELEKLKIITGYQYIVDVSKLQRQVYRLLVITLSRDKNLRQRIYKFSENHPLITKFIECLGQWDYELEVEARDNEQISILRAELLESLPDSIDKVIVVPLLKSIPCSMVPFADL